MATLVLTAAVGAVAGDIGGGGIFGPFLNSALRIGANYVGSAIDNKILPASRQGLQLADLSVQTSTYGKMIPIVYGNMRVAGNVIWAEQIQQTATTTSIGGGKGGGLIQSNSETTYSYSVTMAIGICLGPIDEVIRIWADALLLDTSQGTYRVYTGSETQEPDTYIQSVQGVGTTPAYRGLAYVFVENFPLAAFGNRIPNFTFEVKKRAKPIDNGSGESLEEIISGIVMIPGSGEFVYDTTVENKVVGEQVGSSWVQSGSSTPINQNNGSGVADSLVALSQLQQTLPNIEWVSLVVTWFGNSTNAGSCTIVPGVEYKTGATTEPNIWSVGSFTRATAHQITLDSNGDPIYGGTPNDAGVLRYLQTLRTAGYKIMFYPMFFMDVTGKPWRGTVTGSATDVANFFTKTNGYNAFIEHYANLVNGYVDGFIIGSELIGLTSVVGTGTDYPAVDALVSLAATVKGILGSSVTVTYAADWSEYHHTTGGWYNLDPLWASSNIDVIGIDAYFPLTAKTAEDYNVQEVINGWTSGEGWSFYYTDTARTIQASLSPPYAWKNIAWWWSNHHVNPDSTTTSWLPESKPIWFTEYGFPSVDCATNQPNIFYDPNASDGGFPYFSQGHIDFMAQRIGLLGTELQWAGSSMIQQKFVWTWDARPFPYWPNLVNVWTDGPLWQYGHWVEGKLGISDLGAIVADICLRAGMEESDFDVSRLTQEVDGYAIISQGTFRSAIETLQAAYFFDAVETDGILKFIPRGNASVATIAEDNLARTDKSDMPLQIKRDQEVSLPQKVNVNYLSYAIDYQPCNQHSEKIATESLAKITVNLPIVLTDQEAKNIADTTLYTYWMGRTSYQFYLPQQYSYLDPCDVITINADNGAVHTIRMIDVQYSKAGITKVTGVAENISVYNVYSTPVMVAPNTAAIPSIPSTDLEILDIPAYPGDAWNQAYLRFSGAGLQPGWQGAQVFRSDDGGNSYSAIATINIAGTIGQATTALAAPANVCVFDIVNTVTVILISGELANTDQLSLLNGANTALLGNEIIQFQNATLVSPNKYTLSVLLRGRLGTENQVSSHVAGENFTLLDNSIVSTAYPTALINVLREYKGGTFGEDLSNVTEQNFTYQALCLKPYSPVNITGARDGSGNLTVNWMRRTRIGGAWLDYSDVPLSEESEAYSVDIMNGSNVVRTLSGIASPSAYYSAALQTSDFGSVQSSVSVNVYQLSATVGRGWPGSAIV